MRVLIVEDNADIAGNIGDYLEVKGHSVDFALNGKQGLNLALSGQFDVIILDVNLPFIDGFSLCRQLRENHDVHTPVLMLTARDTLADKVSGFQAGAWDYLVKPFELDELSLRLDALALRLQPNRETVLSVGHLELNVKTLQVTREGKPLDLHRACVQILEILMRASPNIVPRQELEYALWEDIAPDSDPLRSHIHELRRKMDKPFEFAMLRTVRGMGYRLISESEESSDA